MNYTIQCGSCRNTLPETDFRGQFQGQYYKSCIRCREYSKEYYQHKKSTKIKGDILKNFFRKLATEDKQVERNLKAYDKKSPTTTFCTSMISSAIRL